MQDDDYTQDIAGRPGAVSAASPRWLRLTRSGDTITGYDSTDGTHWTQVGAVRLAGLSSTVQAGMFAASPQYTEISQSFGGTTGLTAPTQGTAVFDHFSRSGSWPGTTWADGQIGGADRPGSGGYHQAGGRFSVTGSGDIAPVVAGPPCIRPGPVTSRCRRAAWAAAALLAGGLLLRLRDA